MAVAAGLACLAVAALMLGGLQQQKDRATVLEPSPGVEHTAPDEDGFPTVDWEHWLAVNPDVVGWVTVPGTSINHPVVQASAADPDYYLEHDVYRERNVYGCPFLDADCAAAGLLSPNAVIYAHHMDDGTMFSDFSKYADAQYAADHAVVLLQTPSRKERLAVRAVDVIDARLPAKRTAFGSPDEHAAWWSDVTGTADVLLGDGQAPERCFTFCTCSYNFWANERTLVYAAPSPGAA